VSAPIRNVPREGELLGTVRTLEDAVDVFRMMKDRLGLTNQFLEDCYGFAKGHPDKVLGRSEQKRLGYDTFRLFCEVFAVEFRVYVDPAQIKRMEAIWEERERPAYKPDAKPGRIAKKILEAAKPIVYRDAARKGGQKRAASLPAKLRSKIARKGGKSRMKRISKAERSAMSRKGWATRKSRLNALATPAATPALSGPDERDRHSFRPLCTTLG